MNPLELMTQGNVSMDQLIEQIKDPNMKMMAQMMAKQQAEKNRPALRTFTTDQPSLEVMRQDIRELIRVNKDLIQKRQSLELKHEQLKMLNATVASAMGACECWGQNMGCPSCQGQGRPGTQEVNQTAFSQLIAPFFQALMGQLEGMKQSKLP